MEQAAKYEIETVRPKADALIEVEQQRAIAETQGSMVMAKRYPRDTISALDRIVNACTRPGLAEAALYEYARGGTAITGPSIRLAEAIAQAWGNLQFGIREIEQRNGISTVEAYAWDLETNTKQNKVFQVKHERYTKQGSYKLVDPRDIYEQIANQGARRLRACILGVIPGDVVESAVDQCETTLKTKAAVTPERIASLLEKFGEFKVTKEQIETRIQRHIEAMTAAQMVNLGKVYNSLKDGISSPSDWFEVEEKPSPDRLESLKERLRAVPKADAQTPPESLATAQPGAKAAVKCPVCGYDCMSDRGLKRHMTQQHPPAAEAKTPIPPLVDFETGEVAGEANVYENPRVAIREEIRRYSEIMRPAAWQAIANYYRGWEEDATTIERLNAMLESCKKEWGKQAEKE